MAVRITHTVHHRAIASLVVPGSPVYRDIVRRAIKVQGAARRRVRVDTGRLRSSINVTAPHTKGNATGARVGSNVEYALFQEEGTRYMQGQPYLRPGLSAARG
jgi:HK97 gp10 family phage protein